MDSSDQAARHPVAEDPQKLLQKLKNGTGYWHELATALPALQRAGFDWLAIEAETGLERALQSIWTIAGQVFETLKQQNNFPNEKLAYFNTEDSEYKLYPMRVLAVQARGPVAEYIVDHDLNTKVIPHDLAGHIPCTAPLEVCIILSICKCTLVACLCILELCSSSHCT